MVTITVRDGRVHVELQGWHRLWALKSDLEIPLAHIKSVRQDAEPALGCQQDGAVVYDVQDPERTIALELEPEDYRRLVVEVADPAGTVRRLDAALAGATA